MRLTKMQRQVLRHFANEWERPEGSETLREQQVAGSLGLEQHHVSRSVAVLRSYGYLRKRGTSPDYHITLKGLNALKPWPVRYGNDILVVIIGAIIAAFVIWLGKFLIQTLLSRFR